MLCFPHYLLNVIVICASLTLTPCNSYKITRRAIITALPTLAVGNIGMTTPALADGETTTPHKVLILGGGGRTAMATTELLLKSGSSVISTTRSGNDPFKVIKLPPSSSSLYTFGGAVDVRSSTSIKTALETFSPTDVIYLASASKKGGDAREVDWMGVENAAGVVGTRKGVKLTVVSALALDQTESKGYKMTNSMGGVVDGILDYKLKGEEAVVSKLRKDQYTIIRPGVLLSGKGGDAGGIELNIGDEIGGGLSRDELGNVIVASLNNKKSNGKVVEVYRKSTRTKLMPEYKETTGKEKYSDTWNGLWD